MRSAASVVDTMHAMQRFLDSAIISSVTTSDLDSYPAPHVAVDVAVVTVLPEHTLGILVLRRTGDRAGSWALPGRFVRSGERLTDAVTATLHEKCGFDPPLLRGRTPRQLHVFDDPARDDRGWVMSVAHLIGLPVERIADAVERNDDLMIAPIKGSRLAVPGQRRLPYEQDDIVSYVVDELRRLYSNVPDPEGLIEANEFTLAELRDVHSAVLGDEWQIDTFRRHMQPLLDETGHTTAGRPGRPAALYRQANHHKRW